MEKTTVLIMALLLTGSLYSFSEDELGPEYGKVLNVTVPYDRTHPFNSSYQKTAWSPDGKWIAFTSYSQAAIYIVNADGGEARTVYMKENDILDGIDDVYYYSIDELCFSSDSQRILFQSSIVDTSYGGQFIQSDWMGGILTKFKNYITDIESIDIYTGEHEILIRGGFNPSPSHDGRYIAYIKFDENTWLSENPIEHNGSPAIYDTVTKETRYLTDYTIPDISITEGYYSYNIYKYPIISPDNKSVYITMTVSGSENIARIPFEGGTPQVLTSFVNPDTRCSNLSFSPDKNWIGFSTLYELLIYNISSGKVYDFFTGQEFSERNYEDKNQQLRPVCMSWSPTQNTMCYNLYRNYSNRIYVASFYPEKYSSPGTFVNSEKPDGFSINGNYPNPFNGSTTIEFSIPEPGNVTLVIHNISGQKVAELINGHITSGKHTIFWNGIDKYGRPVSSGIYISRIQFNGSFMSNSMTLLK